MPSSAIDFRPKIGLFYGTLAKILHNKTLRQYGKPIKTKLKKEILSWTACISALLVYALCTSILLLANDVETNPGPCMCNNEGFVNFTNYVARTQEIGFADTIYYIQAVHKKVDNCFKNLVSIQQKLTQKVNEQDRMIENLENLSYQNNIKVFGIEEDHISTDDQVSINLSNFSIDTQATNNGDQMT